MVGAGDRARLGRRSTRQYLVTPVPTRVGERPEHAIFPAHEQHRGIADLVSALHARLSDLIAATDALPASEEGLLLPLEDVVGRVGLDREHATLTKGSEAASEGVSREGCNGCRGRHGPSIEPGALPYHGDKALLDHRVHCNRLRARHDAGVYLDGGQALGQEGVAHANGYFAQPLDVVCHTATITT